MKSFKLTLIISLLLAPGAFAREDSLLARITVYWASGGSGSDRDTRNHRCATGARLRDGHCAVDPRHIPYGSHVLLPTGETLAAVDTGTAVKTRKAARQSGHNASERSALVVDRFFETKRQALSWAACHPAFMPIKVLRPNSPSAPPPPAGASPALAHARVGPGSAATAPAATFRRPAPTGMNRMGR